MHLRRGCAIGVLRDEAYSTVRLSLGRYNTADEVCMGAQAISETVRDVISVRED